MASCRGRLTVRAINVLLRHRAQRSGRTVVTVLFLIFGCLAVCPAEVDELAGCVGDAAVAVGRGVLIDQCCPHRPVAHTVHEFPDCGARIGRELVTGIPEIMNVETGRQSGRYDDLRPFRAPPEVARRSMPPFSPRNTRPSAREPAYRSMCRRNSSTNTVGRATLRTPAADLGEPAFRRDQAAPGADARTAPAA